MNFKYLIIFSFIIFTSFGLPKNLQKKVDKEIKVAYNIEAYKLIPVAFDSSITDELPSKFGNHNLFSISRNDNVIGYAYVSKAPSKTDEFDYLVLFDNKFIIMKSKVLIYREDYGSEIGSKRWLKQLIGKSKNDDLIYGDNIAAISGATISVKSMTNAINNLLKSIKILHHKKQL